MRLAILGGTLLAASAIGIGSASASTLDWWPSTGPVANQPAPQRPKPPKKPTAPPSPAITGNTTVTVTGSTGTIYVPPIVTSPSGHVSTTINVTSTTHS
jgi:hypothetical protein